MFTPAIVYNANDITCKHHTPVIDGRGHQTLFIEHDLVTKNAASSAADISPIIFGIATNATAITAAVVSAKVAAAAVVATVFISEATIFVAVVTVAYIANRTTTAAFSAVL